MLRHGVRRKRKRNSINTPDKFKKAILKKYCDEEKKYSPNKRTNGDGFLKEQFGMRSMVSEYLPSNKPVTKVGRYLGIHFEYSVIYARKEINLNDDKSMSSKVAWKSNKSITQDRYRHPCRTSKDLNQHDEGPCKRNSDLSSITEYNQPI